MGGRHTSEESTLCLSANIKHKVCVSVEGGGGMCMSKMMGRQCHCLCEVKLCACVCLPVCASVCVPVCTLVYRCRCYSPCPDLEHDPQPMCAARLCELTWSMIHSPRVQPVSMNSAALAPMPWPRAMYLSLAPGLKPISSPSLNTSNAGSAPGGGQ